MPFVATHAFRCEEAKAYLADVYSSIVLKDVIQREAIRDAALLKRIYAFAMANVGNCLSANSIVKSLKNEGVTTSATTVINYLDFGVL